MDNKISEVIDKLIPRGGNKPDRICVSLEEYLSRLSNLNRKLYGTKHRMTQWKKLCEEHLTEFSKSRLVQEPIDFGENRLGSVFTYSSRDIRLENEFEVLLYSITSALSSVARVVACFIKNSTHFHSHSKLYDLLKKQKDFEDIQLLVSEACDVWATEFIDRRDIATHYIALSITSSVSASKKGNEIESKTVTKIALTKKPIKYVSLWDDILPTLNGSSHEAQFGSDGEEIHKLLDAKNQVIVLRESPLPEKPEMIDGEKYVDTVYEYFNQYILNLLSALVSRL